MIVLPLKQYTVKKPGCTQGVYIYVFRNFPYNIRKITPNNRHLQPESYSSIVVGSKYYSMHHHFQPMVPDTAVDGSLYYSMCRYLQSTIAPVCCGLQPTLHNSIVIWSQYYFMHHCLQSNIAAVCRCLQPILCGLIIIWNKYYIVLSLFRGYFTRRVITCNPCYAMRLSFICHS